MSRRRIVWVIAGLALGLVYLWGSGDTPLSVSGTVYLDGRPLALADVFYVAADASAADGSQHITAVSASTDDSGQYRISDGIVPGNYRVVVRALIGGNPNAVVPGYGADGLDAAQLEAAASAVEAVQNHHRDRRSRSSRASETPRGLPPVYSDATQTILRVVIPETGLDSADLHLSTESLASAGPQGRS